MSLISQMNFQNPWWIDRNKIYDDEHVKRALSSNPRFIVQPLDENLLIMGPRQVGKTTYMKTTIMSLLEREEPTKILFFSCDSLKDKEDLISLMSQYRSFINPEGGFIFLDEITYVKDWNVGLLHLFNAGYFKNTRIYVSGSSSVSLLKETLPGRPLNKIIYYPLNFRVFFNTFFTKLKATTVQIYDVKSVYNYAIKLLPYISELNRALLVYVRKGGFLATNYVGDDPINSLYEVYKDAVLSDLAKLGRDERIFKEILGKIVESYGSRISENTIAKETSIGSHNTVASYLDLSEKLFILRVFRKIEGNKVNIKSLKKVYFIDPFIFRVIKRYTKGGDIQESEIPHVIEGMVGEHLAREYEGVGYTFFKNGKEVDFVVNDIGIEVKWGGGNFRDLKMQKGYILTLDDIGIEGSKAKIPVSIFLYLISSEKVFYPFK
ncbi:AAA+ family ATPase [Acidianus hospitalis W1]|uniref:AAA+ family ATPase n=1 Tax=Acidianus hospitalis (strain W1) TaxID=933801 RepID=F4B4E4_ACIHW|nr:ATP-binding protein [Acidianus hospitalis]AEE93033.1 AAA+ family ATPase [Acidianus hospitalis W1]